MADSRVEWTCDMAEVYGVFDYHVLSVDMLITLTEGLGPNSRTGLKLSGAKVPLDTILLARIYDDFEIYLWSWSEDAKTGKNKPKSLANTLTGADDDKENKTEGFKDAEDFRKAREEIIRKHKKG